MIEIFAITLATIMIPTAPLNSSMPENYTAQIEPTNYIHQINEQSETGTVHTPNGTSVEVEYPNEFVNESNIDRLAYKFIGNEEYSGEYININGYSVTLRDKNIYRVGDPTTTYNALAFAFYMYWENLDYSQSACVMKQHYDYLEDYSYVKVNDPQVNDIVCYFSDTYIINAGIVQQVNASEASDAVSSQAFVKKLSKCWVQSMWGFYGLYQHRGDLCPFVGEYAFGEVTDAEAVRVEYYRRHETHNFVAVKGSENGSEHTGKCDGCGYEKPVEHNYTYTDKTSTHHTANCDCGIKRTEEHTWTPVSNIGATRPGMVVRCISCSFLKRLNPDEYVPVIRPLKMPFDIKSLIK